LAFFLRQRLLPACFLHGEGCFHGLGAVNLAEPSLDLREKLTNPFRVSAQIMIAITRRGADIDLCRVS
jgi:hypothetical protein